MHRDKPLSPWLEWVPALRFTLYRHINVFAEPSDNGPYPRMLAMRFGDVMNYPEPIAVYSVCPDDAIATHNGPKEMRRLKSQGFGLVTVDSFGNASILFPAIPLIQAIPEPEFKQQLRGLPRGIRQRASEAFEDYRNKPLNGVKTLSELLEGMIRKAGNDAVAKRAISRNDSQASIAKLLDALHAKYSAARAAIGGARMFNNYCRNLAHHWPQEQEGFVPEVRRLSAPFPGCLRTIQGFRKAMKNIGLSGNATSV